MEISNSAFRLASFLACFSDLSNIAFYYEYYTGTIAKYGKFFIVLSDSDFYGKNSS